MKSAVCVLFLLALIQIGSCQNINRLTVDSFAEGFDLVFIVLNTSVLSNSSSISSTSFYASTLGVKSTNILGGERDLEYTVDTGSPGRVFSTSVSVVNGTGQWQISTPNGGSGVVLMQYDGVDNSIQLQQDGFSFINGNGPNGQGIDLTENGLGVAFHVVVQTDNPTLYTFKVYSPTGNPCVGEVDAPGGSITLDTIIFFSNFTTACSFTNVGSIEVYVQAFSSVDTITTSFTTYGPASSNPSPGAPAPSASTGPGGLTWYHVDDDYNRNPCDEEPPAKPYFPKTNHNIVYYYFYQFNDYVNNYGPVFYLNNPYNSSPIPYALSLLAGIAALIALF